MNPFLHVKPTIPALDIYTFYAVIDGEIYDRVIYKQGKWIVKCSTSPVDYYTPAGLFAVVDIYTALRFGSNCYCDERIHRSYYIRRPKQPNDDADVYVIINSNLRMRAHFKTY